jgi:Family of unknown function (DUF5719)
MRPVHLVPAAAVLLALGAIAAVAQFGQLAATAPSQAITAPGQAVVTSAARACPPVPGGGSGTVAFIAGPPSSSSGPASVAGQAGGFGQAGGSGQAELTPLPLAGAELRAARPVSQDVPGLPQMLTIPAAQGASKTTTQVLQGWSVTANGTMAQAMEAEVAQSPGLATVRCSEPGSDIWFVGPGEQSGVSHIQLDLMNIDSLAASVDINVMTDAGRVEAGNVAGLTVPPHQTVTESLSSLADGSSVVAIEVRTTIGRVAADVSEASSHGGSASWLPSTAAPSTYLVIPGVAPSSSPAGLYIAVPGSVDATVTVLALTPQGPYRPFGLQTEDLPASSASYVPLTALGGTAAALELESNVPVTAAVLVPGSGLGALTAATAPISEQAIVAGNTSGSGLNPTIVLSAPAGAARVRLTEVAEAAASGRSANRASANGASANGASANGASANQARASAAKVTVSQVVSIRAGHTLTTRVSAPRGAKAGASFAVVITPLPGSGPVYAARVETQGQNTVVSIIPAVSALTTIGLLPARNSYDAISP